MLFHSASRRSRSPLSRSRRLVQLLIKSAIGCRCGTFQLGVPKPAIYDNLELV